MSLHNFIDTTLNRITSIEESEKEMTLLVMLEIRTRSSSIEESREELMDELRKTHLNIRDSVVDVIVEPDNKTGNHPV